MRILMLTPFFSLFISSAHQKASNINTIHKHTCIYGIHTHFATLLYARAVFSKEIKSKYEISNNILLDDFLMFRSCLFIFQQKTSRIRMPFLQLLLLLLLFNSFTALVNVWQRKKIYLFDFYTKFMEFRTHCLNSLNREMFAIVFCCSSFQF